MPALLLYSCFCILLQGRVKPGNKMEKYLDKCDTAVRQGNYSFKLLIHFIQNYHTKHISTQESDHQQLLSS